MAHRFSHTLHPLTVAAFLAPIISAPSGRGLVPLLALCGAWALVRAWRDGTLVELFEIKLLILVLGLLALCAAAAFWSPDTQRAIGVTFGFAGLAVAGLSLVHAARKADDAIIQSAGAALVIGLTVALVLLWVGFLYGYTTGHALWGGPEKHPYAPLSHGETVLVCLLFFASHNLWARNKRLWLIALWGLMLPPILLLGNTASALALAVGLVIFILVLRWGEKFIKVFAVIVAAAVFLMPVLTLLIPEPSVLEAALRNDGFNLSDFHRLFIWQFVTERIWEQPWLGWGMDSSRAIPGGRELILWGIETLPLHPHNGALQVWLELGVIGAVLVAAWAWLAFQRTAGHELTRSAIAVRAGAATSYLVYGLISYGIWQSWWISLAWLVSAVAVLPARELDPSPRS